MLPGDNKLFTIPALDNQDILSFVKVALLHIATDNISAIAFSV
jgi:hypothetical protein